MAFRDRPWWPSSWSCAAGSSPAAAEVRRSGILEACRFSVRGLRLVVECDDRICEAFVPADTDNADELKAAGDLLGAFIGRPFRDVEGLDL